MRQSSIDFLKALSDPKLTDGQQSLRELDPPLTATERDWLKSEYERSKRDEYGGGLIQLESSYSIGFDSFVP